MMIDNLAIHVISWRLRPRVFGEEGVMASESGEVSSGHDAELDELLDS